MAQFTIYRHTDSGAPALNCTQAGSLITVLDACLVNGYGSKPAAGWTKAFTGTNKAAYRPGAGVRHYLQVLDNAPLTTAEARVRGYESMTDVDTGTDGYPTTGQLISGVAYTTWRKGTASQTAAPWLIAADNRTMYLFTRMDGSSIWMPAGFGDAFSYVPGDAFQSVIFGRNTENNTTASFNNLRYNNYTFNNPATSLVIARGYNQSLKSVPILALYNSSFTNTSSSGDAFIPAWNPGSGHAFMSPLWLGDKTTNSTYSIRGVLRGLWRPLHLRSGMTDQDTLSGTGELAGKTFLILNQFSDANDWVAAIETSDTLPTN